MERHATKDGETGDVPPENQPVGLAKHLKDGGDLETK
jgi:hypothetical protein